MQDWQPTSTWGLFPGGRAAVSCSHVGPFYPVQDDIVRQRDRGKTVWAWGRPPDAVGLIQMRWRNGQLRFWERAG
jgi:hypothetical protein